MKDMRERWDNWIRCPDIILDSILSDMNDHFPKKKKNGTSYREIAYRWITIMPFHAYALSNYEREGGYQISLNTLLSQFPYVYNKKDRWFYWFCDRYPIWEIIAKGNEYKGNSRALIHPSLDLVLETLNPEQQYEVFLNNIPKESEIDYLEIDLDNLDRFINQTEDNLKGGHVRSPKKINEILKGAKKVKNLALAYNEQTYCDLTGKERWVIPQPYKISPFGRKYYVGGWALQLQNSRVRTAAIGKCWSIDIDASVFRFFKCYSDALGIDCDIIDKIIRDKQLFREVLADTLENVPENMRIKLVKQAMTAIGFGARDKVGGSISKIIWNIEDRNRLINHPYWIELKKFIARFKKELRSQCADAWDKVKGDRSLWTDRTATPDRIISYFYQRYESKLMSFVYEQLENYGRQPTLLVHDGLYTRLNPYHNGIWNVILNEVKDKFNPFIHFEIVDHEKERHYNRNIELEEEEEHRQRMRREHLKAISLGY